MHRSPFVQRFARLTVLMLLAASCTSSESTAIDDSAAVTTTEVQSTVAESSSGVDTTTAATADDAGTGPLMLTTDDLSAAWDDVLALDRMTVTHTWFRDYGDEIQERTSVWTKREGNSRLSTTASTERPLPDAIVPFQTSTDVYYSVDGRLLKTRDGFISAPPGVSESLVFVDLGDAVSADQIIGFGPMIESRYIRSLNISTADYMDSTDGLHQYQIEIVSLQPRIFVVNNDGAIVGVETPPEDDPSLLSDVRRLTIERTIDESLFDPLEDPVILSMTDVLAGVNDNGDVPVSPDSIKNSIDALLEAPELTLDHQLMGPVDQGASYQWIFDRDGVSSVRSDLSVIAADAFSSPLLDELFVPPPEDDEENDRGMGAALAMGFFAESSAPTECRWDSARAVISSASYLEGARLTVERFDESGLGEGWDFDFVGQLRNLTIDKPWIVSEVGTTSCPSIDDSLRRRLPDADADLDVVWLGSIDGLDRVAVFESLESPGPATSGLYSRSWILTIDASGQIRTIEPPEGNAPIGALVNAGWTSTIDISYDIAETIELPPVTDVETFGE